MLFLLLCLGCPNTVVQTAKFDATAVQSASYPEDFTVSNGLKGKIEFSWSAFKGAKKYYVYSSSDEYAGYTKCYETADTSFAFTDMPAGIDRYYYVVGVMKNGSVSNASEIKRGTTLASPILNSIEAGNDEINDAVVSWYMNNADAYADDVEYTVSYYSSLTGGTALGTTVAYGEDTTVTFKELGSYKNYYYYVVAHNKNEDADTYEDSGTRVDYRTAAETTPQPVTIKSFIQGTNGRYISINFELPEMVRVAQEGNALYPLKFQISRQLDGESTWYVVDTFVGETDEDAGKVGYYEQIDQGENDSPYVQGSLITWTDKYTDSLGRSVEVGKNYNYMIKSYADYKNTITSSKSIALTSSLDIGTAYLFVTPSCSVSSHNGNVSAGANSKYDSYTTTFSFSNTKTNNVDLSTEYDIYIGQKCEPVEGSTSYSYTKLTQSSEGEWGQNKEWSSSLTFVLTGDDEVTQGSYSFFAFVCKEGIVPSGAFSEAEIQDGVLGATYISGKYLIYEDVSQPEVADFSVVSGMKSKVTISFTPKSGLIYTVFYSINGAETEVTIDGSDSTKNTSGFTCDNSSFSTGEELGSDLSTITITHTVTDFSADYIVTATKVLTWNQDEEGNNTTPATSISVSKTETGTNLGTPKFSFTPSYKDITVKFSPVNKAESYKLTYTLPASDSETNVTSFTEEDGVYTCTISGDGLDVQNMLVAGKSFSATLTATSTAGSDNTSSYSSNINILGPAATNVQSLDFKPDSITIAWDAVDGASAYVVRRYMYNTTSLSSKISSDYVKDVTTYLVVVSNDTCTVTANGDSTSYVDCDLSGSQIVFKDSQCNESGAAGYKELQSMIQWGYPYGYVVFPVNKTTYDTAIADFGFEDDKGFEMDSSKADSGFYYSNFSAAYNVSSNKVSVVASAVGYGLNLKATKAESAETIALEWDEPYDKTNNTKTYIYYRPQYYHDAWGSIQESTDTTWNLLATIDDVATYTYDVPYSKLTAYIDLPIEFMVTYYNKGLLVDNYESYLETTLEVTDSEADGYRYVYSDTSDAEQQNVGYFCALPNFIAKYAGNTSTASGDDNYFKEQISWDAWNTNYRKLAPASFKIEVKNKNVATTCDWSAALSSTTVSDNATTIDSDACSTGNVTANSAGKNLYVVPTTLTYTSGNKSTAWSGDGYYDGYLKVQRDYKHYYALDFTLSHLSDGSTTTRQVYSTDIVNDNFDDAYAYRNITLEESLKNELLILGDALTQTGWAESSQHTCSDTLGTFATFAYSGSGAVEWGTFDSDYRHSFQSGASSGDTSKLISGYVIKFPKTKYEDAHVGDGIGYYAETPITVVSHDSGLSSYVNSFAIKAGKTRSSFASLGAKYHLWVNFDTYIDGTKANNSIHIEDNQTAFQSWLPYWLGNNGNRYSTYASGVPVYSTELGWWN